MFSDLVLYHLEKSPQIPELESRLASMGVAAPGMEGRVSTFSSPHFRFSTCLREIMVLPDVAALDQEINDSGLARAKFVGTEAYHYMLEIICGLHSPLVGETEVMGQFRQTVNDFMIPHTPYGIQARRFLQTLLEDAKRVRERHLRDLGSQSYGSLVRRELRDGIPVTGIHILGAGHLTQEILPWIAKDSLLRTISVYARRPDAVRSELQKISAEVSVYAIDALVENSFLADDLGSFTNARHAIVISAPLSSQAIMNWLENFVGAAKPTAPLLVLDLRGEAKSDPLDFSAAEFGRVVLRALPQLMQEMSKHAGEIQVRKQRALDEIANLVQTRERHVEYRPFGWDDVCA